MSDRVLNHRGLTPLRHYGIILQGFHCLKDLGLNTPGERNKGGRQMHKMHKMHKTTLILPNSLYDSSRKYAYENQCSLSYLFREAIEGYLGDRGYLVIQGLAKDSCPRSLPMKPAHEGPKGINEEKT